MSYFMSRIKKRGKAKGGGEEMKKAMDRWYTIRPGQV